MITFQAKINLLKITCIQFQSYINISGSKRIVYQSNLTFLTLEIFTYYFSCPVFPLGFGGRAQFFEVSFVLLLIWNFSLVSNLSMAKDSKASQQVEVISLVQLWFSYLVSYFSFYLILVTYLVIQFSSHGILSQFLSFFFFLLFLILFRLMMTKGNILKNRVIIVFCVFFHELTTCQMKEMRLIEILRMKKTGLGCVLLWQVGLY